MTRVAELWNELEDGEVCCVGDECSERVHIAADHVSRETCEHCECGCGWPPNLCTSRSEGEELLSRAC